MVLTMGLTTRDETGWSMVGTGASQPTKRSGNRKKKLKSVFPKFITLDHVNIINELNFIVDSI